MRQGNKEELFTASNGDMKELSSVEKMFVAKSELIHKAGKLTAISVTLLASFVAWIGLYIAEALGSEDVTYAIFALVGAVVLPIFMSLYYAEASILSAQAARIEAKLYSHNLSTKREGK